MPNPTMKAIHAEEKRMREEFIKTTIRTPRNSFSLSGCDSSRGIQYYDPPRYRGNIQKVGDQRTIIEYMKEKGKY